MDENKSERSVVPQSSVFKALPRFADAITFFPPDKKRFLVISLVAVITGALVSLVARLLIYLINIFTNISFFGEFSVRHLSPAANQLGLFVIVVPVIGGLLVGLMAVYGSKAIRGHGIPEAMEQILTNHSKIHPSITWLKPLSSAISIGTGGPFGAEGPVIATGGALGSTIGQLLRITPHERKVLLAAGATAGMSAIFGTPVAAIFLAIELLLFEFSPRSVIPVALACITGAAGHRLLFETGPVFPAPHIEAPGNTALFIYSIIGLVTGIIAALVTKAVYYVEDAFEKLPVHWALWPAIGGLGVGLIGYFAPLTLGVGYENITGLLSGSFPLKVIFFLCVLKFISWAIALGSGTSGGTLAPLLTIGGATGVLLGMACIRLFPYSGVVLPLAAMIGMSAMFAGASRALLTSIVFALEATGQSSALLPLLGACTCAYVVSYFMLENTIMTEKIARRGVKTPNTYEPDLFERVHVKEIMREEAITFSSENTIAEIKDWLSSQNGSASGHLIVVNDEGDFTGLISLTDIYKTSLDPVSQVGVLVHDSNTCVTGETSLRAAALLLANRDSEVLPVVSNSSTRKVIGAITYKDMMAAYQVNLAELHRSSRNISIRRSGIKILLHGRKLLSKL